MPIAQVPVGSRSKMKRNLSQLEQEQYDIVVVGGGIFGICVAWDAALRGLSVALVEQGDFGHATSANHFRMVHGGLRYLQHADLSRVRESSVDRNALLRIAPHLVHPVPFVVPTYGHGLKGKEAMTVALFLYDLITSDRNRGIHDEQRCIPPGRIISRHECLEMFPGLEQQGLTGAAIFHEAQMYNPTRLSLSFLRAAVNAGAVVANYVQVTNLIRKQNRIIGVAARDRITGDEFDIRGRIVINAAGPWAEQLLERNLGNNLHIAPSFSRDALFLIRRPLIHNEYALALSAKTKDKDALLSRGTRHLFLVPWRDYTLAGVWHVAYRGKPDEFTVTEQELQSFLDEINSAYPPLTLTLADITMWNAGLILFGDKNDVETSEHSFGKRSLIVDHSEEHRIEGLLTVIGVRYTTARSVAEKVVNHVFRKMEYKPPQSATATTPIYGGQIECFGKYLSEATRQRPPSVCAEAMPSLVHNYGSAHQEVLKFINEDTSLGDTIGDSSVLQAEVIHAVREEMALKLADVVLRRTDLGTGGHPGDEALYTCAELMAKELSWDESRTKQELVEVQKAFPHF